MLQNKFDQYSSNVCNALSVVNRDDLGTVINIIRDTSKYDQNVWLIGNGGSASTASHFATDLSRCINSNGQPIKGISLCDNLALITAIGNDFNFEVIFVKQLINLARKNDLLIAFSASGNSANIIKAIEYAKSNQIRTVAITAFDGGPVKKIADYSIHVPTAIGDYGVAEDSHLIISHFISSQLKN